MLLERIWTVVAVALSSVIISYLYFKNIKKEVSEMANTGLLFVSNIAKAQNSLAKATQMVQKLLYIKLAKNELDYPVTSKQIYNIYNKATSYDLDVRLMVKPLEGNKRISTNLKVDTILYDSMLRKEVDSLKQLVPEAKNVQCIEIEEPSSEPVEEVKRYDHVVIGGTFDRLHNGHKILLSQAVLRANKKLTVGVTDVNMITSKKLYELIEPVDKRVKSVIEFLTDIQPNLEYRVIPIQDMYGPTKSDPDIQLIILSEETVRGGDKINQLRKENNLPILDTYVIGLSEDTQRRSNEEEAKVSSTNQRMRLLGTLLRPVLPNPDIPAWPYVIGLAGGIASGKSSIAKRLEKKGAGIINCDTLAHELYAPGSALNATVADTFGRQLLTDAGEIDRKQLGQIVFSDPTKLEKLNSLVWPAILSECERRVRALGASGRRVVVVEAAVMVRARWYTRCHQLWSVIIPPEEAIKRIQARNGLSEEEARRRVESQVSNLEQVEHAHIVFSPYWSYEHTQEQVDRAWDQLQELLKHRT